MWWRTSVRSARRLPGKDIDIKKGLIAAERDKSEVRRARQFWINERLPFMREQLERLVFLDETGTNTKLTRTRGRCLNGARLFGKAPFGYRSNQTLIAGMNSTGIVAPWVIPGPLDREAFDTYVESVLAPSLDPGTVVILDNLRVHKSEKAAKTLKERGCWFLYLPPYSPDLNPIEMAFSKLKSHLRRIGARTIDSLIQAIGDICELYTPDECLNYFRASGYAS